MRYHLAACLYALLLPASSLAADLFVPLPDASNESLTAQQESIGKLLNRPTTVRADAVALNIDALESGEDITIHLPNGPALNARGRIQRRGANDFTWYGGFSDPSDTAILVVRGRKVIGSISTRNAFYQIQSIKGGAHALVQVDENAFPPDHPSGMQPSAIGEIPPREEGAEATQRIDVMVVYTPKAQMMADDTGDDINARIQLSLDETNQAYLNSAINAKLRLVHTALVDYTEGKKEYATMRGHLRDPDDGRMDEVHALRDAHAADIVLLVVDYYKYDGGPGTGCGQAEILATADTAFAAMDYLCITGPRYTFGHEIGHLQGALHDPYVEPSNVPFRYGHGYVAPNLQWRTIMAYPDKCGDCDRVMHFSNPDVQFEGAPTGNTSKSNNARVINDTASRISKFRRPASQ